MNRSEFIETKKVVYSTQGDTPIVMETLNGEGFNFDNVLVGGTPLNQLIHSQIPPPSAIEITTNEYTPSGKKQVYHIELNDSLKHIKINLPDADSVNYANYRFVITGKVDKDHKVQFSTTTHGGAREKIVTNKTADYGSRYYEVKHKTTVVMETIHHSIAGEHSYKWLVSVKHPVVLSTVQTAEVDNPYNQSLMVPGYSLGDHTLQAHDTILLANQATTAENGVYIVPDDGEGLIRHPDFPVGTDLQGKVFTVLKGSRMNQRLQALDSGVIGTNSLAFMPL